MRKSKSYNYYGPIPRNEYTTANSSKNADTAAVLGVDPQAGDRAYRQRLIRNTGWAHTWKANGWRAEAAAQYDEFTDITRYLPS